MVTRRSLQHRFWRNRSSLNACLLRFTEPECRFESCPVGLKLQLFFVLFVFKFLKKKTMSDLAKSIVEDVLKELDGRSLGMDSLDDDIRQEIEDALVEIVDNRLNATK